MRTEKSPSGSNRSCRRCVLNMYVRYNELFGGWGRLDADFGLLELVVVCGLLYIINENNVRSSKQNHNRKIIYAPKHHVREHSQWGSFCAACTADPLMRLYRVPVIFFWPCYYHHTA